MFKRKSKKEILSINLWPQNGDVYFWVRSDIGGICMSEWADNVSHHEFRKSIGNIFRTKHDAEIAIVRQQARVADKEVAKK